MGIRSKQFNIVLDVRDGLGHNCVSPNFFFFILSVFCSYFMFFVLGKLTELKLSGVMRGDWVSVDSFV